MTVEPFCMAWVMAATGSEASLPVTGVAEVLGMLGFGLLAQFFVFRRTRSGGDD